MRYCSSCGHQLGVGRYCINCGHRVEDPAPDHEAWRTDTMERPAVPPDPPAARFPLYADEPAVEGSVAAGQAVGGQAVGGQAAESAEDVGMELDSLLPLVPEDYDGPPRPTRQQKRLFAVLVAIVAVWALVAVIGAVLFFRSDDNEGSASDDPATTTTATTAGTPSGPARPTRKPPVQPPKRVDVARLATARAPSIAPPTEDVDGQMVRYGPARMLDGDPTTCWRAVGDATGDTLIFTLRSPTRITRVGLVNGYAKTVTDSSGNTFDWYDGNRRVLKVEWEFDDGSTVEQELREVRRMQTIRVPKVISSTVRLKLVEVSEPGSGIAARDNTPISEISIIGRRLVAGA